MTLWRASVLIASIIVCVLCWALAIDTPATAGWYRWAGPILGTIGLIGVVSSFIALWQIDRIAKKHETPQA